MPVSLEILSCSVNGQLNGIDIVGQDLHCYVVTEDGRTYTAISRISDTLGWQMQVQYSTVQCSTVQYSTVQFSTVQVLELTLKFSQYISRCSWSYLVSGKYYHRVQHWH